MLNRGVALLWGVVCHSLFLAAILASMINMYMGMQLGVLTLSPTASIALDICLLLQFPILHSFLLSRPGSKLLAALAPLKLGSELSTTTFVIIASLQMLALYLLWVPVGPVWWSAQGYDRIIITLLYLATWLFLGRSMSDAGLATQTGLLGWKAVFEGKRPNYDPMPTKGLFKYSRQPIYLAFALTTWIVPVWSLDQLILALWFTSYCFLGPYFKERRYQRRYGEKFELYRKKTPYFFPSFQ